MATNDELYSSGCCFVLDMDDTARFYHRDSRTQNLFRTHLTARLNSEAWHKGYQWFKVSDASRRVLFSQDVFMPPSKRINIGL